MRIIPSFLTVLGYHETMEPKIQGIHISQRVVTVALAALKVDEIEVQCSILTNGI